MRQAGMIFGAIALAAACNAATPGEDGTGGPMPLAASPDAETKAAEGPVLKVEADMDTLRDDELCAITKSADMDIPDGANSTTSTNGLTIRVYSASGSNSSRIVNDTAELTIERPSRVIITSPAGDHILVEVKAGSGRVTVSADANGDVSCKAAS